VTVPYNTRCHGITAVYGGRVHVYSSEREIVLQIRREIPSVDSLIEPSFKVAVELSAEQAADLAAELLRVSRACLV
jgi:hypothetical protein